MTQPIVNSPTRRRAGVLMAALAATLLGATAVNAQQPASPLTITVVDVAGNLALTQEAFEAYRVSHPKMVEKFVFTKAPAPELPGKLKAMQAAGRSDIDLVLTGTDVLAAGIEQQLWQPILPHFAAKLPGLNDNYLPGAARMQTLAQNQGLLVTFTPAGPLLEYNPDKVKTPPTSPAELLAWCKANPNRLVYGRPANSGPGRTFLMGLPYLLGDKNPADPVAGWDKTWAFLKELDNCIEYYTAGTGAAMKEFGEGSRDMTVTMTGWDINPRALGVVPANFKVAAMKGMSWVNDAHYMAIPKQVSAERTAVLIDIMAFMLQPAQQALTYDKGYFYPGPAIKNVPVSAAPATSQQVLKEFGRPEYDKWLAESPNVLPLDAKAMVEAFRKWDADIGARKQK